MKVETLAHILDRAAAQWPARTALIDEEGNPTTYRALEMRAAAVEARLFAEGVEAGSRVAILSRNSAWAVAAYFGVQRAGCSVVYLNHTLEPKDLGAIVQDCRPAMLLYERAFQIRAKLLSDHAGLKGLALEETLEHERLNAEIKVKPDDVAAIVYTSGSTSRSLGVMLTHRNLISNNLAIMNYMRLTFDDRVCCVLPFYYIYGLSLLLSHFLVGGSVVMDGRFLYPQIVLDAMEETEATGFSGVSSHYIMLINNTNFLERKLPILRYFTHAGDKMPVAVTQKIATHFPDKELYLMYGQTEASPRVSFLDPLLVNQKPASVGKAISPDVRIRIIDDEGAECEPGQEGEITVQGPNVMKGYWNAPDETEQVLKGDWLHTGDIGCQDEDGDLFVTGRKKQFLKIGGHRVNPLEIEAVTMEFGGIKEAAAVGTENHIWGQVLKVFVVPAGDEGLKEDELMAFFKTRLPSYKVPASVEIMAALPKNSQGKVDKKRLAGGSGDER